MEIIACRDPGALFHDLDEVVHKAWMLEQTIKTNLRTIHDISDRLESIIELHKEIEKFTEEVGQLA